MMAATIPPVPRMAACTFMELEGAAGIYADNMFEQVFNDHASSTTIQWATQITTGLACPFSMLKSDAVERKQFELVYDLVMHVNELKQFIQHCELVKMFMIYPIADDGLTRAAGEVPRNLLDTL